MWNAFTKVTSDGNITCKVNKIILLARVLLQDDIIEYYPAGDMLSTNEISNIAYEY